MKMGWWRNNSYSGNHLSQTNYCLYKPIAPYGLRGNISLLNFWVII